MQTEHALAYAHTAAIKRTLEVLAQPAPIAKDMSALYGKLGPEFDEMIVHWEICKQDETSAQKQRREVEKEMQSYFEKKNIPLKSGTNRFGRLKIEIKETEEYDQAKLTEIHTNLIRRAYKNFCLEEFPFQAVWEKKAYALPKLRKENQEAYAVVRDAIEIKPPKWAFSVSAKG